MPSSRFADSPPEISPVSPRDLWISRAITLIVVAAAAIATLRPLISTTPWMLFLEDDFFYYLKVAANLASGHGSTFNGIVATNGYHPLWLLLLTLVCVVSTAPKFILGFVALAIFVSSVAVYLLTRRLLQLSGLALLPASALAVYATIYSMHVFFGGMEIVLTVPLVLLVAVLARSPGLWETDSDEHATRNFALLGLATSAMILSRLDTILLAALIAIGILSQRELSSRLRPSALLGLGLGLAPVVLYFLSNLLIFHTLLPVSGQAKQLKTDLIPSPIPWASAFHHPPSQLVNFLPVIIAIAFILLRPRRLSSTERAIYLPVLAFPFLYIALLSVLSDWQLWGWYLYPFRTALCISFAVLCTSSPIRTLLQNRIVTVLLLIFVLAHLPSAVWRVAGRETIYNAAVEIQTFARTHPGTYAMGDRSGMVGWLLPYPVVQTEGLVMDRHFINSIKTQRPLLGVLAEYNVRYYVATSQRPPAPCFQASEPFQAGPSSPHMRSTLCQSPLAILHFGDWYNIIYDLTDTR